MHSAFTHNFFKLHYSFQVSQFDPPKTLHGAAKFGKDTFPSGVPPSVFYLNIFLYCFFGQPITQSSKVILSAYV